MPDPETHADPLCGNDLNAFIGTLMVSDRNVACGGDALEYCRVMVPRI
jgi:hypothetical protein